MAKKQKKEQIFRIGVILAEKEIKKGDFAKAMGVNEGTVSEWINHKVYPHPSRYRKIAEVLNVNMQEILIKTSPKS